MLRSLASSILVVLLVTFGLPLSAQSFYQITHNFYSFLPTDNIDYLEDPSNSLNIMEVINSEFSVHTAKNLYFGYSGSTYWFKTGLVNTTDEPQKVYIELGNHFLEDVDVFFIQNDTLIDVEYLGLNNNNEKAFMTRTFAGQIIQPADSVTIYISVQSRSPLRIRFSILSEGYLTYKKVRFSLVNGIFYGMLGFLLIFCLLMYLRGFKRLYLYFLLALITFLVFQYTYDYLLNIKMDQDAYVFLFYRLIALNPLVLFFSVLFSEEFFDLEDRNKGFRRILQGTKIASIMLFISYEIFYFFTNRLVLYLFPIVILILLIISIRLYLQGKKHIRFYIVASITFYLFVILHILLNAGLIYNEFLVSSGLKIGYILYVVIYAFALADSYFYDKEHANRILEEQVKERTRALNENMVSLQQTQQKLIQSEKLASIGNLTKGVAHEINNPLNFISGAVTVIEKNVDKNIKVDEGISLQNALDIMKEGIDRISRIVTSLSSFTLKESLQKEKLQIDDLLGRTLIIFNSRFGSGIQVVQKLKSKAAFYGQEYKIQAAISSIMDNAIYELAQQTSENVKKLEIRSFDTITNVILEIENTGSHIPEEVLDKVLEPFYSTKDPDKATGLGLSIANAYISEHDGIIQIENTDTGVCVRITLPLA
ncbi:7TM-DISM domain-containing protein [Bacteroidota bacterium]